MRRIRGFIDLVFDTVEVTTNLVERTHDAVVDRSVRRFAPIEPAKSTAKVVTGIQTVISGTVFESIRVINGCHSLHGKCRRRCRRSRPRSTVRLRCPRACDTRPFERGRDRELVCRLSAGLDQRVLGRPPESEEQPSRPRHEPPPPRATSPGHAGGFCSGVSEPDKQSLRLRAQSRGDRVALEPVLGTALR